jgi:hypothetical protein
MSLVGRLEDLSLGEILQIVSLSKRSGLLRLEGPSGKASLFIRAGKVIYAASSDEKEDILSHLAGNGLIKSDQLEFFRESLESTPVPQDFRDLLENRTGISREGFQEVLQTRVEDLTYSLFIWEEGTFSFQLIEDESTHPLLSKVAPFFLDEGIGAQFLVMEGARRKDEMMRDMTLDGGQDRSPIVDPDKVLGDDWEQEFEQHLTGSAEEMKGKTPKDGLEEELKEFIIPETLPQLPDLISKKVVAVGIQAPLVVDLTGGFVRAGIDLLLQENGADALTKIQELRQRSLDPYLLVDLEATAITDGRVLGGLEIVSTMWDLGFHLPVGLVCRREVQAELDTKLRTVTGLSVFRIFEPHEKSDAKQILEKITESVGPAPGPREVAGEVISSGVSEGDRQEGAVPSEASGDKTPDVGQVGESTKPDGEYYDIEQEFSEELGDIDLPLDDWEKTQMPPKEAPLDPHMARLSSYVRELNSQDIGGEITLLALRFASVFTNRAILFLTRKNDIKGLGQFGVDLGQDQDADSVVRSLNLPLEENSIFHLVTQQQQSYKGPPTGSGPETALFEALGGGVPGEIFIGPIVSMGKVAVLLYGDDFPQCDGLEPTHTLDIFLSHVGLALDRAFLEMKLKSQRS